MVNAFAYDRGRESFPYNQRFPGQDYQAETGLNQNLNRDYDPVSGKYLESDPLGLGGDSYSTYSYAYANPITFTDPLGLWGWGDPIDPTIANSITGFGDAFLIPILVRSALNYGTVDQCSTAYRV